MVLVVLLCHNRAITEDENYETDNGTNEVHTKSKGKKPWKTESISRVAESLVPLKQMLTERVESLPLLLKLEGRLAFLRKQY